MSATRPSTQDVTTQEAAQIYTMARSLVEIVARLDAAVERLTAALAQRTGVQR